MAPRPAPGHEYILTLSCPDRPGIVHAVTASSWSTAATSARASSSATARPAASSCGSTSRPLGATDAATLREAFAADRRAVRHELRALGGPRAVPHADHGLASGCTASTTCSSAQRRASCRSRSPRSSPTTGTAEALARLYGVAVPPHPGHAGDQGRRPRRELLELVDELDIDLVVLARYMQVLSDDLCQRADGPGDQHPPLVPAELQGRPALPPGARPRRQADRRHGALRHRRPRRGPDHRAGRRCASTTPTTPDAAGRRRPRRRGAGAVPRASRWHAERRVLLNGDRTVVFR